MSAALFSKQHRKQPCYGLLVSLCLSLGFKTMQWTRETFWLLIRLQNNIYTKNWRSPTNVSAWLPQTSSPSRHVCGAPVSKSLRQPYNGPLVSFCLSGFQNHTGYKIHFLVSLLTKQQHSWTLDPLSLFWVQNLPTLSTMKSTFCSSVYLDCIADSCANIHTYHLSQKSH